MFPDDVTEAKLINEFQERVSDLVLEKGELRRFLRARNHDISKAEDMLRKSMVWREECHLDEALNWDMPDIINEAFPFYIDGKDKDGRLAFYFPAGRWEARKMITAGWKEDMERKVYSTMSKILQMLRESECDQFVIIIDLAELTYWKIAHYETVQMILKVFREYEQNFPERLQDAIVINAPWALNCIFPLVKPLITGRTMQKVQIFDSNPDKYLPAVLDIIPEKTLPSQFQENLNEIIQKQSG